MSLIATIAGSLSVPAAAGPSTSDVDWHEAGLDANYTINGSNELVISGPNGTWSDKVAYTERAIKSPGDYFEYVVAQKANINHYGVYQAAESADNVAINPFTDTLRVNGSNVADAADADNGDTVRWEITAANKVQVSINGVVVYLSAAYSNLNTNPLIWYMAGNGGAPNGTNYGKPMVLVN